MGSNRPAMASVLIFQKPYLIDAGPNILHSIKSLGASGSRRSRGSSRRTPTTTTSAGFPR